MKISRFDRAVAAIAPTYGMKRIAAKQTVSILGSGYGNYGANLTKKNLRGWAWRGGSAKEDIEDNLDVLRQRSRDAYMGVPVAASALKTMRTNVIAGGLMPAPQVDGEYLGLSEAQTEALEAQILREFDLWADSPECDMDGLGDFYDLQQLAFLGKLMNGDAFALLPMEKPTARTPYGLRVRVLEADRVCSPEGFDRLAPCKVQGRDVHRIVQGVETDKNGRVVAYWVASRHPLATDAFNQKWQRVEARGGKTGRANILHLITRERAGQVRGVPLLAPVLEAIKQLGRYTEAEITAAVISAMFTVFITSENPADAAPLGEVIPPEEQVDAQDPGSIEMGNGAIVGLNPGENALFADPKHPSTSFDKFYAAMVTQIAAALEEPPEVINKQFSTSYSAARGALNEFWRVCGMQRDWFVSGFCQPIYEEWLAEAVARGRISAPGFFDDLAVRKAYSACVWNGPARTNLNPIQEVAAAERRVAAGFSTAQEETQQMSGGNYTRNIRQRLGEAKQLRRVREIEEGAYTEQEVGT